MHNQTSGKAMKHALAEAKGTGIFVVPDVDSNEDTPVKAVEVTGLTYAQCVLKSLYKLRKCSSDMSISGSYMNALR